MPMALPANMRPPSCLYGLLSFFLIMVLAANPHGGRGRGIHGGSSRLFHASWVPVAAASATAAAASDSAELKCSPPDCSGHGRCVRGFCACEATHTGSDCATEVQRPVRGAYPGVVTDVESKKAAQTIQKAKKSLGRPARVCLVTTEFVGPVTNGGIGTAFTTFAIALAKSGVDVTVLFTMGAVSQQGPFSDWAKHYKALYNIELVGLYRPPIKYIPRHMMESYEVMRFLRERNPAFDVVHTHDYQGAAYYSLLARQQGLWLTNTPFVIQCHGPNLWAKRVGNEETIDRIGDLEMDYQEKRSVQWSDYVVSPSRYLLQWMAREGWPANANSFVQPNVLPYADRSNRTTPLTERQPAVQIEELVFFGRLETRKGIVTFCDAVERLLPKVASGELALKKVTFLGRGAMVHGKFGVQYVQDRAREWGVPWKVISRYGPVEAKNYLREGGRLAVMPSRIENSPYTVYECCELGLPFVASDVGGVADLVHPEDHDGTLFTPDVDTLTSILERALKEGVRPARPRVSAQEAEDQYVSWTWKLAASVAKNVSTTAMDMARKNDDSPVPPASPLLEARALPSTGKDGSHPHVLDDISMPSIAPTSLQESKLPFVSVVMTHYQRPKLLQHAIEAVARQDYPADRYELILWDDGSKDEETKPTLDSLEPLFEERNWKIVRGPNVYLGAARNRAFEYMNNASELVIFTDDDNYLKPYAVRMFATAMNSSNADVLTSFVDFFWGEDKPTKGSNNDRPSYLFLGGSSDVGAFKNSFGDANCCIRRSSFVKIGGYTEDYGVGFEDWEMYANATLRNFKVDIVPDALYFYRFTKGSMQKTTNYFTNRRRSLRPYLDSLPSNLHHVILSAVFPRTGDNSGAGSPGKPTGLAAEGDSRFHGVAGPDGVAPAPPQAGVGSKRPQASTEGAGGGGRMAPLSPNGGGKGGSTQSLIGGRKKDEL
ncbi:glycosyl transferase [Pycnococcus provasolii]